MSTEFEILRNVVAALTEQLRAATDQRDAYQRSNTELTTALDELRIELDEQHMLLRQGASAAEAAADLAAGRSQDDALIILRALAAGLRTAAGRP